jgi:DNA mismatch repair ATPase MutL
MYPINAPTPQNNNSIGSSIDEFMKVFLFKEMMGSLQKYNDYQNYMSDILPNMYIGLEDMDGFRKYKRYKNRNRPRKKDSFYQSEMFNDYKNYGGNGDYSFNDSKLPFINTGKSLSRKKESNSNNRLRFMTSHLSNNKKETNETKKTKDTKESKESKEKKKESTSSQKSSSKKSSEDENSSSSGGSEDSNENSEDDDNNSNSEDESENSSEEKKDENNNNNKEKNEEKTEEKKEENNNQEKKENEDKKNEEAQKPIINLAETPQQH